MKRRAPLAAEGGHLEVLVWAREQHCPWNHWQTHESARAHGRLEVLRWLDEQRATF